MAQTTPAILRKINGAGELQSVVRTMKALAASSIGQYENSVRALEDYYRTVELGLGACLRENEALVHMFATMPRARRGPIGAVVFGSDQGLVGQFNDVIVDFVVKTLAALPGEKEVWAVGERARARLADAGLTVLGQFDVPSSVGAITPLVGRIQIESDAHRAIDDYAGLYVFHNRPTGGDLYEPASQRLLPLDAEWQQSLMKTPWPTNTWPEVIGSSGILAALVREYLFISLFRACAESLASENASRLSAMERADKNIEDLLGELRTTYHRVRQSGIDEELFDVVSGFEALGGTR
jgi:F-type H+-transporting ATPase subunit gamma